MRGATPAGGYYPALYITENAKSNLYSTNPSIVRYLYAILGALAYSFLSPLNTSTPSRSCSRKTSVRIVWGHNLTLNPSVSSPCSNARRRDLPCSGPSTEEERQALCLDGLHYDLRYALRNRASQTWRKGRMEKRTSALLFAAITRDLTTSAGAQTARRAGLAPVGFY